VPRPGAGGGVRAGMEAVSGLVELPGPGPGPWVWPWWLQRQLDPASPAWLPADLAGRNRTGRHGTVLGVPDAPGRWVVDRRGLLAPASGRWALDWWVGAEDRWRVPSREVSTGQRLLDGSPVVETIVRVPGGEVVARHWAAPSGDGSVVLVEFENASAAPVALALSLRPVGPSGPTGMRRIAFEGDRLVADGTTVLRFPGRPRQSVLSTGARGDVAITVLANETGPAADATVECPSGWASAALIWPLAHRATLRVEVPDRTESSAPSSGAPAPPPTWVTAEEVARGWSARVTRATRVELPEGPLTSALEAQRGHLLLAAGDGPLGVGGRDDRGRDAARVVAALTTAGLREEASRRLDSWMDGQHRSGRIGGDAGDTAGALWALGVWADTGPDDGLLARSPLGIARAAELVARSGVSGDPTAATWRQGGLQAAARLLARLDEQEAAQRVRTWADAGWDDLLGALSPPRPSDGVDASTTAALLAVVLGVLPARHDVARAARVLARRSFAGVPDGAVAEAWPSYGLRPELALDLATSSVLAGEDPSAVLRWVLSVASPTWTWPTVVDPRLGSGSHGSGHDPVVAAALWKLARSILVDDTVTRETVTRETVIRETVPRDTVLRDVVPRDVVPRDVASSTPTAPGSTAPGSAAPGSAAPGSPVSVALLPVLLPGWLGAGIEVHGLPTVAGPLSFALRWHGERPALLWQFDGDGMPPRLTAGGLDPAWSGAGRRGEALLAPIPPPDTGPGDLG
jgi:hypothetical protein